MTANLLSFCLRYLANIKYNVSNLPAIDSPVIIGCNHQSTWETLIIPRILDKISIVIKEELLDIPLAGFFFRKLNCIAIDRSSPINAIKQIVKRGEEAVKSGYSMLIFVNGTRSSTAEDNQYKSGVYALYKYLKIPVIPACVNSGEYWPRRSFLKRPGTIMFSFGEPITEAGLSREEFFKVYADRVCNS